MADRVVASCKESLCSKKVGSVLDDSDFQNEATYPVTEESKKLMVSSPIKNNFFVRKRLRHANLFGQFFSQNVGAKL